MWTTIHNSERLYTHNYVASYEIYADFVYTVETEEAKFI